MRFIALDRQNLVDLLLIVKYNPGLFAFEFNRTAFATCFTHHTIKFMQYINVLSENPYFFNSGLLRFAKSRLFFYLRFVIIG